MTLEEAAKLLERARGLLQNCSVESGVCCCGDDMERHASPMHCGHTPVDSGAYYAGSLLEEINKALKA